ncbi:hypothetical protein ACYULU_07735 [Breznakiellaceae bacterium SP9]
MSTIVISIDALVISIDTLLLTGINAANLNYCYFYITAAGNQEN